MGINIDPKLVEVTPKIYVMDTGGCTDETRDISKYKNSDFHIVKSYKFLNYLSIIYIEQKKKSKH